MLQLAAVKIAIAPATVCTVVTGGTCGARFSIIEGQRVVQTQTLVMMMSVLVMIMMMMVSFRFLGVEKRAAQI